MTDLRQQAIKALHRWATDSYRFLPKFGRDLTPPEKNLCDNILFIEKALENTPKEVTVKELVDGLKKKYKVNGSSALAILSKDALEYIAKKYPNGVKIVSEE